MARTLKIRDLTLRDGQQSAFATRMNQSQVERVLPFYKDAKFYAMEVWGGAVPDSIMRYLNENPWTRLETIKAEVGDVSKLTALSRGRNLFGYAPYSDEIIEGFCRNSIESGLGIMRIFDALNDVDNVKSTIKYVKKYGGIADCAVCYTIDPKYPELTPEEIKSGKKNPEPVFTDDYFVNKAKQMVELGADMITIKDMSGLIPPKRTATLIKKMKNAGIKVPIDFHTHCTPGYGLASVVSAIAAGAEVVDTNIWYFAGGPAAPAIELIYLFCKKMDIKLDINMEAVAKINKELLDIRKELKEFDTTELPQPFNPLTDKVPAAIEKEIERAAKAAKEEDEETLIDACHKIEDYFGFPKPNLLVKDAEIPGGMYTNMVAQLKAFKSEDLLEKAMKLIPPVRLDAGLPPLVTPTSQIVGAQAVNCALSLQKGKDMYSNTSNQFVALVKGEYGKTPIPVDPEFRLKITGSREEIPYDTSKNVLQPNPTLDEFGGVKLAENEKEELLLELFPMVAKEFLTRQKKERWEANGGAAKAAAAQASTTTQAAAGNFAKTEKVLSPLPGRIVAIKVKVGDTVKVGQDVATLEAMKMENSISAEFEGVVTNILVSVGDTVAENAVLIEVGSGAAAPVSAPAPAASAPVQTASSAPAASGKAEKILSPLPGRIVAIKVKVGDTVKIGQDVATLEAMKMENSISSEFEGVVSNITVNVGDTVAENAVLIEIGGGSAPVAAAPVPQPVVAPAPVAAAPAAQATSTVQPVTAPAPRPVSTPGARPVQRGGQQRRAVGGNSGSMPISVSVNIEDSLSAEFAGRKAKITYADNAIIIEIEK